MSEPAQPPIAQVDVSDLIPYADAAEAQQDVTRAFQLLVQGQEAIQAGRDLLLRAEQRMAWKVLGFDSMEALVKSGLAQHRINPAYRLAIAATLREQDVPATEIASIAGVSLSTVIRDLHKARESGLLNEPEQIVGRDGRKYTTDRQPYTRAPSRGRRPDLAQTWKNAIEVLGTKARSIQSMRQDDRYQGQRETLLDGLALTQITQLHQLLGELIDDARAVYPNWRDARPAEDD